jgi:hypothetical protein
MDETSQNSTFYLAYGLGLSILSPSVILLLITISALDYAAAQVSASQNTTTIGGFLPLLWI